MKNLSNAPMGNQQPSAREDPWVKVQRLDGQYELAKEVCGGTALGASPTWCDTQARKGIVHARAKVRGQHVDELFFSDLPTQQEREDILRIHIKKFGRLPEQFDVGKIANMAVDFSGAELAQVVVDALYWAFQRDREPNTQDLLDAVQRTHPLSKTMPERIESVREWAKGRAVPANQRSEVATQQPVRQFIGRV